MKDKGVVHQTSLLVEVIGYNKRYPCTAIEHGHSIWVKCI